MLIRSVLKNEAKRNLQMIDAYKKLLATLPKGALICRKNEYYYLKYRENGKIHDEYIGKDHEQITKIRTQLDLRKHYSRMLAALEQEQRTIEKLLGELT